MGGVELVLGACAMLVTFFLVVHIYPTEHASPPDSSPLQSPYPPATPPIIYSSVFSPAYSHMRYVNSALLPSHCTRSERQELEKRTKEVIARSELFSQWRIKGPEAL